MEKLIDAWNASHKTSSNKHTTMTVTTMATAEHDDTHYFTHLKMFDKIF